MTSVITHPWESEYEIEDTEILAETDELRVLRITLAPGQHIPWHYHSNISDRFICIEGTLEVKTRVPQEIHILNIGNECEVSAKVAHLVSNTGAGRCRFIIIQGVGAYDYLPVTGG